MLPMHQRANPHTSADRDTEKIPDIGNVVEPNLSGPHTRSTIGGNRAAEASSQEPIDEPFHEMTKEAQVWKTYVRETDRWDKEMVDGRNNSLDVLLIFAALFSAVSTAFIIESLKDLKQDYTASSAQTLLVMSRTLAVIAKKQPGTLSVQDLSDPAPFTPPHSAVAVNVLWLSSLSLSIAVSLVTMLAKGWCHRFMSGRFGQIYDQARRRQQKWNGIEKWRTQEFLTYLPALMHLAVILFGIGLCIHLWSISTRVAWSVIVIGSLGVLIYGFFTILPAFDEFCPYNTPVTVFLGQLYSLLCCQCRKVSGRVGHASKNADRGRSFTNIQDILAPMDTVTSQMLAWMIENCEDFRSVDIALQAIAGARPQLPRTHLSQCGALELVYNRLKSCVRLNQSDGGYQLKGTNLLPTALKYSRAYTVLVSRGLYTVADVSWKTHDPDLSPKALKTRHQMNCDTQRIHLDLLNYATKLKGYDSELAAAEMAPILCYDGDLQVPSTGARLLLPAIKPEHAYISTLRRHVLGQETAISSLSLLALVEYSAYYLITGWPVEKERRKCALPAILIHIFLASHDTTPEIAGAVAVILAGTALAIGSYSGREEPSRVVLAPQKRAMRMLEYYRNQQLDDDTINRLFVFGVIGLLPHIDVRLQGTQDVSIIEPCSNIVERTFRSQSTYDLYGLPHSFAHPLHCMISFSHCLLSVAYHPRDAAAVESALAVIQHNPFIEGWAIAAGRLAPLFFDGRLGGSQLPLARPRLLLPAAESECFIPTLRQHASSQDSLISTSELLALVKHSVYHLVIIWPNQAERRIWALPAILIYVFLSSHDTTPDIACTAAIVLAAAALALNPPEDERTPEEIENRQKHAIEMLQSHQAYESDKHAVYSLFVFGLVRLLPLMPPWQLKDARDAALIDSCLRVVATTLETSSSYGIYRLPNSFSLNSSSFTRSLLSIVDHPDDELALECTWAIIQENSLFEDLDRSEFYLPTLVALRYAQSPKLRSILIGFLESLQQYPLAATHAIRQINEEEIVDALCNSQHVTESSLVSGFLRYFRLLLVSIMLSKDELDSRRIALRKFLNHDAFAELSPSPTDKPPFSKETMLTHIRESTDSVPERDGMLDTMQLVTDFCQADVDSDYWQSLVRWIKTLWGIKVQENDPGDVV